MNLVYKMIIHLEKPALVYRTKKMIMENKPQSLALFMFLALIYLIYVSISIQSSTETALRYEEVLNRKYLAILGISTVLSTLFIYLTKDKLKGLSFINFFYNSRLKAHHFILGSNFFIFTFHILLVFLAILPISIVNYFIFGKVDNLLYFSFVSLLSCSLIFLLVLTVWMGSMVICRNHPIHYVMFFISLILISSISYQLVIFFPINFDFLSVLVIIGILGGVFTLTYVIFRVLSSIYLIHHFRKREESTSRSLGKMVDFKKIKNNFLKNSVLEIIYLIRGKFLSEQLVLYFFLVIITVFLYYALSSTNFLSIYGLIVNFGLVEVLIIFPIMMGANYHNNKIVIYNLNFSLYDYFLSRSFIFFVNNFILFVLFTSIMSLIINMPYNFSFYFIPKVLFVTLFSIFIGYVFVLNQFNKIFLMLGLVVSIGLFDTILHYTLNNLTYVNTIYIVLSGIILLLITQSYIRRPVVR